MLITEKIDNYLCENDNIHSTNAHKLLLKHGYKHVSTDQWESVYTKGKHKMSVQKPGKSGQHPRVIWQHYHVNDKGSHQGVAQGGIRHLKTHLETTHDTASAKNYKRYD